MTTTHLQRGDEPTTLAVTTIHEDGSASYNFYIEGTADRLVEPRLVPADIACFGTAPSPLNLVPRYAQLLKDFAAQGTLVALDPNIRPFYATPEHRAFLANLLPTSPCLNFLTKRWISSAPISSPRFPS